MYGHIEITYLFKKRNIFIDVFLKLDKSVILYVYIERVYNLTIIRIYILGNFTFHRSGLFEMKMRNQCH